ncbi:MAG: cytochrome c [Planctomycetes bacterium]|nr:cytochrome c [Planctomycetota bacterium]
MRILAEAPEHKANRPMPRRSGARWSLGCKAVLGLVTLPAFLLGSCKMSGPVVPMPPSESGADLFAAHCAACHGSTGAGEGPARIALEVRPRDFRTESFRYVSTMNYTPTQADLVQTIRSGRRHGDMPAHPQLTDQEVVLLAAYIHEIARLGLVERLTKDFADDPTTTLEEINEIAGERLTPDEIIVVPELAAGFRPNTSVGRELYVAACASCHGPTGRGDGLEKPEDEHGNPIAVRDLTLGAFRGGTSPKELFKRIRCGIPGTPMPSQYGLTDEEIWELVYYSRFLAGMR